MITIAIPVSVFRVECEVASGRPFAAAERTILKAINAGNVDFEALKRDLAIHPRLLAECLTALFEAGIVEFGEGAATFSITAIGKEALQDPEFIPSNLSLVRRPFSIVVDRITGMVELASKVTFERADEVRDRGVRILPPADLDPIPARSAIRRLAERRLRTGEWVRSVGRIESRYRYNCVVQVNIKDGRIERLSSDEWIRALSVALREHGVDVTAPPAAEPDIPWVSVSPSDVAIIGGGPMHAQLFEKVLAEAMRYVFVHSAFLSGVRVGQLSAAIAGALARGIDVIVVRGGSETGSELDEQGVTILRKLGYDHREMPGRFFFDPHPTYSHSKVLLWDGQHACIGSFNWLSARPGSGRAELSVLISCSTFARAVADIAADLIREGSALWPLQSLTSVTNGETPGVLGEGCIKVRLIPDGYNRECLFNYLDQAQKQIIIASDKITPKEDPLLHEKLLHKATALAMRGGLTIRYSSAEGSVPLLAGLQTAGATLIEDGKNHTKAAIWDGSGALITSFNLLSFGGRSTRRASGFELGVELRGEGKESELFNHLFQVVSG